MIRAILACDNQGGIARNGVMPWPKNSQDLSHFQTLTKPHTVVMGRQTWEAPDMPSPLSGRTNIVVTRNSNYVAPGAIVVSNNIIDNIKSLAANDIVYIIGGSNLFHQLIDVISVLHLTRITGNWKCDTHLDLGLINSQFEQIDSITIDPNTTFETYIARRLHDFYPTTNI